MKWHDFKYFMEILMVFSLFFYLSGCKKEKAECGNGVKEGEEVCDGNDFGGDNCQKHNFLSGYLTCTQLCDGVTFGRCVGGCGNEIPESDTAQGKEEECDGRVVAPKNCQVGGYDYGTLKCNPDCTLDYTECKNAVCGNGEVEPTEECDFDNGGNPVLGGATCESKGFDGGELKCFASGTNNECHFDTSSCETWVCGDHKVDPGENCDFDENNNPILGDETCITRGYDFGQLGCIPPDSAEGRPCRWDVSNCGNFKCGNSILEGDEECEKDVPITDTCADHNFESGDIACNYDTCAFDFSGCIGGCGNGKKEGSEDCDGSDIGEATCESVSGGTLTGQLGCKTDCTFDLSRCTPP